MAGVVDQHIDVPERRECLLRHLTNALVIGDIEPKGNGLAALSPNQVTHGLDL